jgi:hypothetical protein
VDSKVCVGGRDKEYMKIVCSYTCFDVSTWYREVKGWHSDDGRWM